MHNAMHKGKRGLPKSIGVLVNYSIFLAVFYLVLLITSDMAFFFGVVVIEEKAKIINGCVFALVLLITYGFIYRRRWAYHLSLGVYFLSILNSFISFLLIGLVQETVLSSLYDFMLPTIIITLFLNGLTFWFVLNKREYFYKKEYSKKEGQLDKIFVYSIYSFYGLITLLFIMTIVLFFVNTMQLVDKLSEELKPLDLADGMSVCETKMGDEKDLCYLMLVIKHEAEDSIGQLCYDIKSNFYRFTCSQVVS
ncbi:MAG: hypothetical protein QXK37_06060 [Candidatus Woesearchaeota archaeon]